MSREPDAMKSTTGQRILRFPLTMIALAMLCIFVAIICRDILMALFPKVFLPDNYTPEVWLGKISKSDFTASWSSVVYSLLASIILITITSLFYQLYVKKVEKRPLKEFDKTKFIKETSLGITIGSIFLLVVIFALSLSGNFEIVNTNVALEVLPYFFIAATAAFMEELIFRGIIFRITEEKLGSWIALILTGILFGVLHATNPGATLFSTLTIATSAGFVLGAAYILTRRLWLPIGIHFAVNAIQGGVFGMNVSGINTHGIFISKVTGPEIITGGNFGIEASVLVLITGVLLSLILLYKAKQKDKIIKPFWSSGGGVKNEK